MDKSDLYGRFIAIFYEILADRKSRARPLAALGMIKRIEPEIYAINDPDGWAAAVRIALRVSQICTRDPEFWKRNELIADLLRRMVKSDPDSKPIAVLAHCLLAAPAPEGLP